jgi:hypothetical protein
MIKKKNPKQIRNFNVILETIKLLEQNMGKGPDIGLGNEIYCMTPKKSLGNCLDFN